MSPLLIGLALAAPSTVERVVLHPDAATVTRAAAVAWSGDEGEVRFEQLPGELDPASLRAEVPPGMEVTALEVVERMRTQDRRAAVAELDARIQGLEDARTEAQDQLDTLAAEGAFWEALQAQATKQLSAELLYRGQTVADARSLAAVLAQRLPELVASRREVERRRRVFDDQLAAARRQRESLAGEHRWSTRTVTVRVRGAGSDAPLRLSYTTPDAGWIPRYTARGGDAGALSLTLDALMYQQTGEDWSEVSVRVSTVGASHRLAPEQPSPFWIGDAVVLRPQPDDTVAPYVFDLGTASLAGDGAMQRQPLEGAKLPVEWLHVVVPRQHEVGFRVARAEAWTGPWPLLEGTVDAWWGSEWVGAATIARDGSAWELGFGADPAMSVDWELVEDSERGPSLGRLHHTRRWSVEVGWAGEQPATVEVRDRLPVSSHRRVRVQRLGETPDVSGPEGVVHWRRSLPPGAEVELGWGVTVHRPADWSDDEEVR